MSVKHVLSYGKTFAQLAIVAVRAFEIDGAKYEPPRVLKLSPTFWRKYGCYLNCGGCCLHFSLDYIPQEYDRLENNDLRAGAQRVGLFVNGDNKELFSYLAASPRKRFNKQWCDFLDMESGACMIHEENPLSCQVELIKFKRVKEIGYIGKQAFGRAWQMKTAVITALRVCVEAKKLRTFVIR